MIGTATIMTQQSRHCLAHAGARMNQKRRLAAPAIWLACGDRTASQEPRAGVSACRAHAALWPGGLPLKQSTQAGISGKWSNRLQVVTKDHGEVSFYPMRRPRRAYSHTQAELR